MSAYTVAAACAVLAVLLAAGPDGVQARKGFGDGDQEFGYVDVRDGAHMFYWLYYIQPEDKSAVKPADKPLVIWLQGGPGASSTSYGNFMELGPLDANLKRRNSTWVKHVNVLFIDNPVGTGYSYVDHYSQLATDNKQIAADLVAFTKGFMKTYPQFQKTPLYIFCESYGGKMTAEFALRLYEEQKAGNVLSNLKGVALGDSWISPIDSVMTWAPYLLHTGMVDQRGFGKLDAVAQLTQRAVERGRFFEALQLWGRAESVTLEVTDGVDFYNIMSRITKEKAARVRLAARNGDFLGHGGHQRVQPHHEGGATDKGLRRERPLGRGHGRVGEPRGGHRLAHVRRRLLQHSVENPGRRGGQLPRSPSRSDRQEADGGALP
ncbi:retinoid-inducible serine carboxypeptidase-like isoform X3 [Frankliniella occidentalis]|uniref:Retinoid-inducible serine carboxypeptidase-like isoform X3 n=1 Tax=Frankliniella occidentalis TaxID=133901 RepID=A0A9C6XRU3_FRAOC|nr:retinoid-inducible serine carboxypeptidase-like isoform X3 [Frankliniella occidentalis]